ncbi:MAG: single-stranded DNA-binding protein [Clostridiales Family XIII bacterium]|jgi:single-strand DNA-binding protein|nr:single-stranded DNA-binding protein [Clostridiales Family XIII bacterium]
MNLVVLIGNLARDPESSVASTGNTVTRFTLAVNRPFRKEGQPEADFIRCVAFAKTGDFVKNYFSKGKKIAVEGTIQTGSYQDKDGKTIYTTDVIVNRAEFVEKKGDGGGSYSRPTGGALGGGNDDPFGGQFPEPPAKVDEPLFTDIDGDDDMPF